MFKLILDKDIEGVSIFHTSGFNFAFNNIEAKDNDTGIFINFSLNPFFLRRWPDSEGAANASDWIPPNIGNPSSPEIYLCIHTYNSKNFEFKAIVSFDGVVADLPWIATYDDFKTPTVLINASLNDHEQSVPILMEKYGTTGDRPVTARVQVYFNYGNVIEDPYTFVRDTSLVSKYVAIESMDS